MTKDNSYEIATIGAEFGLFGDKPFEFLEKVSALSAPAPQPVDVDALRDTIIPNPNQSYDYLNGYHEAIDHIAQTYHLVKKVK